MKTEAINFAALERILTNEAGSAGAPAPEADTEHPLARELRTVLQNAGGHNVGDLARVVESLMREMAFLKDSEPDNSKS